MATWHYSILSKCAAFFESYDSQEIIASLLKLLIIFNFIVFWRQVKTYFIQIHVLDFCIQDNDGSNFLTPKMELECKHEISWLWRSS